MKERQNTIVCTFYPSSPRITAHQIHDWIYDSLRLPESDIRMIQIDGPRRRVYIKFHTSDRPYSVLQAAEGCVEFRHDNGELSLAYIDLDGMGVRRIRLDGLAPEVKGKTIREVLSPYGELKEVHEDMWSKGYRYQVYNGVHITVTNLKKQLPSRMIITGTRVLISYDGQPPTCCGCNEQVHLNQDCPHRSKAERNETTHTKLSGPIL
jgi:hypothetical protein